MPKYLIDAQLPYYFSLWNHKDFIHIRDIDEQMSDISIWKYAIKNKMTIITKDVDFSHFMALSNDPPNIIHLRFGNLKMTDFHYTLSQRWDEITSLSNKYNLVQVFKDRIECKDLQQ